MAEFTVRGTGKHSDAAISMGGKKVATLGQEGKAKFRLVSGGESWDLDPRVHGEIRPFSMSVALHAKTVVLTIRNHLFFHGGKAYYMTGIPEDVHPSNHLLGRRHINRLDMFPFASLEEVDPETWGRLRRHRGASVGTIEGLGIDEFRVSLSDELEDISLPLSAVSYLLYTTGW